jgi:hypothetical protein
MRRKSPCEIAAIREAFAILRGLGPVMLDALKAGAGVSEVLAAGELAANAAGAQEVRSLFSLDGGRTLQPFVAPVAQRLDPLQVYLAVRRFNYWADGFSLVATQPNKLQDAVRDAMLSAVAAIQAGTPAEHIAALIAASLAPLAPHPLTARAFARRLGVALEEPPATDIGVSFEDGEIYSLRVGASDGNGQHAIASATVLIRESGSERLDTIRLSSLRAVQVHRHQ